MSANVIYRKNVRRLFFVFVFWVLSRPINFAYLIWFIDFFFAFAFTATHAHELIDTLQFYHFLFSWCPDRIHSYFVCSNRICYNRNMYEAITKTVCWHFDRNKPFPNNTPDMRAHNAFCGLNDSTVIPHNWLYFVTISKCSEFQNISFVTPLHRLLSLHQNYATICQLGLGAQ